MFLMRNRQDDGLIAFSKDCVQTQDLPTVEIVSVLFLQFCNICENS